MESLYDDADPDAPEFGSGSNVVPLAAQLYKIERKLANTLLNE